MFVFFFFVSISISDEFFVFVAMSTSESFFVYLFPCLLLGSFSILMPDFLVWSCCIQLHLFCESPHEARSVCPRSCVVMNILKILLHIHYFLRIFWQIVATDHTLRPLFSVDDGYEFTLDKRIVVLYWRSALSPKSVKNNKRKSDINGKFPQIKSQIFIFIKYIPLYWCQLIMTIISPAHNLRRGIDRSHVKNYTL